MRLGVSDRPIRVDKVMHMRLFQTVDNVDTGDGGGAGGELAVSTKGKALKKSAPSRID